MSTEVKQDHGLQIAHILFIDIVGYSKLLSDKQRELFQLLNELVRSTAQFRAADVAGKLVRLPTGDGIVLAFFTSVDAPARCAQEIGRKLREHPQLLLRMGINSGPVDEVLDVDDRRNVTGARDQPGPKSDGLRRCRPHSALQASCRRSCAIQRMEIASV